MTRSSTRFDPGVEGHRHATVAQVPVIELGFSMPVARCQDDEVGAREEVVITRERLLPRFRVGRDGAQVRVLAEQGVPDAESLIPSHPAAAQLVATRIWASQCLRIHQHEVPDSTCGKLESHRRAK